ncbi:MAG: CHAD domain-containing protein [Magnetospirillum sp.]|nr:CHAD domain-containing protein [Magnetospirillum sp.]
MKGREIELKLGLDPADMARLRRKPFLAVARWGRPQVQRLRSVYFDTPDFALNAAGISLRIRTMGGRKLQTVKTAGQRLAGLFDRGEWEAPVAGDRIDRNLLRETALAPLQDDALVARLQPVFTTEMRRTVYRLAEDGWEVELALDLGEVVASATARRPICEAELELVRGDPRRLFALARDLTLAVPARLLAVTKSERGYELAAGRTPQPVKGKPVTMTPDMPVHKAFQAVARSCLDHLLANEPSLLLHHDGEAVHQMRVALRRLRSALKVFRPVLGGIQVGEVRANIRWLLEHLGPARDADVLLSGIVDPVAAERRGDPAICALRSRWQADRDTKLVAAEAAVADRRFTTLMLGLGAWVEAGDWLAAIDDDGVPVGPFAVAVLKKCDRKLRRAGDGKLAELPPEELHRVRILGKQLRYASDFFSSLHRRKAATTFAATLSALQDVLGAINDIAVAEAKLAALPGDGGQAWAAGLLAGWHQSRRRDLLAQAEKAWKRYRKAPRPWAD